jgi:ubiquinone biosynthesis monooxygenase Coq6
MNPIHAALEAASTAILSSSVAVLGAPMWQQPPEALECVGFRASFPLKLSHANKYVAPRVALIGDAAHSVHPLAGQGLNLGLGDVQSLATVLERGAKTGQDMGSLRLLDEYEADRKSANLAMTGAVDTIKRLFSSGPGLAAWARNTGMGLINGAGPVKAAIAKYAMGRY